MWIVERAPCADVRTPLVRELRQNADARANVAAALRVVRLRRQQVQREALGTLEVRAVKSVDREGEAIRIPADHWFMMGDNRGESDDSRFWGPVPTGWIVGGAFATYWPPDKIGIL